MAVYSIDKLVSETRRLAAEYRRATGKTLPVSGEIAVHDAVRLLGLVPAPAGAAGYDAVRRDGGTEQRVQIKARVVFDEGRGYRIGQVRADQDWDVVVLVLMDANYEPTEIYEADRAAVLEAAARGVDRPRARRGALSVARFKCIGRRVWSRELGLDDDGYWSNVNQS